MCKRKDVECPHNGPICEAWLTEPTTFHTATALSIITVPFIFGPKSFSSFCRTPRHEHLSNTSLGQCPGGILAKCLIQGRSALCFPPSRRLRSARRHFARLCSASYSQLKNARLRNNGFSDWSPQLWTQKIKFWPPDLLPRFQFWVFCWIAARDLLISRKCPPTSRHLWYFKNKKQDVRSGRLGLFFLTLWNPPALWGCVGQSLVFKSPQVLPQINGLPRALMQRSQDWGLS